MTGRLLQNMLCSLNLTKECDKALMELGCKLEDIAENGEMDLERGHGGRCRQAACMLESLASCDVPSIAYGLRYEYGNDYQYVLGKGEGVNYKLNLAFQRQGGEDFWEISRRNTHLNYQVGFGGRTIKDAGDANKTIGWEPECQVRALAFDIPIPGYGTRNTNILRLFKAHEDI